MQIVNFDLEQELWMQEGACVFADPDLFFPVGSSMKALKQAAEAVSYTHLTLPTILLV